MKQEFSGAGGPYHATPRAHGPPNRPQRGRCCPCPSVPGSLSLRPAMWPRPSGSRPALSFLLGLRPRECSAGTRGPWTGQSGQRPRNTVPAGLCARLGEPPQMRAGMMMARSRRWTAGFDGLLLRMLSRFNLRLCVCHVTESPAGPGRRPPELPVSPGPQSCGAGRGGALGLKGSRKDASGGDLHTPELSCLGRRSHV